MNSEQKNLIVALILSGVILFGWQFWISKNQPQNLDTPTVSSVQQTATVDGASTAQQAQVIPPTAGSEVPASQNEEVKKVSSSSGRELEWSSSKGLLNLRSLESKKTLEEVLGEKGSFYLEIGNNGQYVLIPVDVNALQLGQQVAIGNYGTIILAENEKGIGLNINLTAPYQVRMGIQSSSVASSSFSSSNSLRKFVVYPSSDERWEVGKEYDGEAKIKWFGVDFDHNLFAVAIDGGSDFRYASFESNKLLVSTAQPVTTLSLHLFQAQKNYDLLKSLGHNLEQGVDFGLLWMISLPILRALQLSYGLIPNYGIGIILLTLLVRLLTYPLQYKSFVSMKKMQNLAPELAKIKEKFKDDQTKVQQESMELFKRTGVNPLGGCLPMILQMPIFFAFYRVLQESVELVGAPFFFWIKDLSHKDPYYILPILVGVVMVVNQKMTPSPSMDPTQKKVMMIMPIVFSFFMKDLPSGLSLYFFVSMLMGIIQQLWVYKKLETAK